MHLILNHHLYKAATRKFSLCNIIHHENWIFFQGESELVAKDDNLDAADPKKDHKNQNKDQQIDEEEKDMINEQGDEVFLLT